MECSACLASPTVRRQPIARVPGGPADAVGAHIAKRLSKSYGKDVTVAQMILDWLKSTDVVAVT